MNIPRQSTRITHPDAFCAACNHRWTLHTTSLGACRGSGCPCKEWETDPSEPPAAIGQAVAPGMLSTPDELEVTLRVPWEYRGTVGISLRPQRS